MRAVSLHPDVIVVTSAVLNVNCVIVRGAVGGDGEIAGDEGRRRAADPAGGQEAAEGREATGESFVIDSPVLPDELDALPGLLEQARFPAPSGLLATHGDWDHLLARLAFPGVALGCAESTAARLHAAPGEAQRELRAFDEGLLIERRRPLSLGAIQALPVPGRCDVGEGQLELHSAGGHTPDGMAVVIPWAGVLVAGDYLSTLKIPTLGDGGEVDAYIATLERLRPLVTDAEHIVPGHGPLLDHDSVVAVLDEDLGYLRALLERGVEAMPPDRGGSQLRRAAHARNLTHIAPEPRLSGP